MRYTMRQISERFGLPASTIRYYEEQGLLTNVGRTPSGQRIFTDAHVGQLGTIGCFKNTGMTIAQMRAFFRFEAQEREHIDDLLALLRENRRDVERQLEQIQSNYRHLLRKLRYYEAIQASFEQGTPHPDWADYANADVALPDLFEAADDKTADDADGGREISTPQA